VRWCVLLLLAVVPPVAAVRPAVAQPAYGDTTEVMYSDTGYVPSAPGDTVVQAIEAAPVAAVRYDSSQITLRRPSAAALEEYRSDNDFVYDRLPRDPESFWDRLLNWIHDLFRRLLGGDENEETFWTWFLRALAAASLVYVVLKIINSNLRWVFLGRAERGATGLTEIGENIHEMNFDELIEEAMATGSYRRGVRLLYLRALKELTDRGLIEWRVDKTNHEYLLELRGSELRGIFADATLLFEYVWYGDRPVDEPGFRRIREKFSGLSSTIAHIS